jgi:hypothetical protein
VIAASIQIAATPSPADELTRVRERMQRNKLAAYQQAKRPLPTGITDGTRPISFDGDPWRKRAYVDQLLPETSQVKRHAAMGLVPASNRDADAHFATRDIRAAMYQRMQEAGDA